MIVFFHGQNIKIMPGKLKTIGKLTSNLNV